MDKTYFANGKLDQRTHRRVRSTGFTLIELLAAISILAIVAVLGWRALDTIVRTRVTLTSELEQTRGMQLAFAQMQSDCENIAGTDEIGRRATLLAEPGRLTLVRTMHTDTQPSTLQVVAYRIRDGVLLRRESASTRDLGTLDELWRATASDAAGLAGATPAVALQSDVRAMDMRVWISNAGWRAAGETPGTASAAPTAAAATTAAPTGLEVTLQLGAREYGMVKVMLLGAV